MKEHSYILEPYKSPSSRYTCPACGVKREFSRYIHFGTRQHLADHVGRCNREHNCGYHYTPKQYFLDNPGMMKYNCIPVANIQLELPKPTSYIPNELFKKSLSGYAKNNFVTYLHSLFNETIVNDLITKYNIGTSKFWDGAVVFWQVDYNYNVRTGKIMLYDPQSGHRVKKPYSFISWTHSVLKMPSYNLQQCFFGEHLLHLFPELPIAIVESEKTAIIASVYFPQLLWIATGGKHGCIWTTPKVWKVLANRKVILWPDINAFNDWESRAQQLKQHGLNISISDLLESECNDEERIAGLDLADFLIRFPFDQFSNSHRTRAP